MRLKLCGALWNLGHVATIYNTCIIKLKKEAQKEK